jgi:hypothetical protein
MGNGEGVSREGAAWAGGLHCLTRSRELLRPIIWTGLWLGEGGFGWGMRKIFTRINKIYIDINWIDMKYKHALTTIWVITWMELGRGAFSEVIISIYIYLYISIYIYIYVKMFIDIIMKMANRLVPISWYGSVLGGWWVIGNTVRGCASYKNLILRTSELKAFLIFSVMDIWWCHHKFELILNLRIHHNSSIAWMWTLVICQGEECYEQAHCPES